MSRKNQATAPGHLATHPSLRLMATAGVLSLLTACSSFGGPQSKGPVTISNASYVPARAVGKDGTMPNGDKDGAAITKADVAMDQAFQQLMAGANTNPTVKPATPAKAPPHLKPGEISITDADSLPPAPRGRVDSLALAPVANIPVENIPEAKVVPVHSVAPKPKPKAPEVPTGTNFPAIQPSLIGGLHRPN